METKNKKDYDMLSSIMNDFKEQDQEQGSKNILSNTLKDINVDKYKKTILKENIKETAFDVKVKPQLVKKNILKRGQAFYPTKKDFQQPDLRETLTDIFDNKNNQFLILRKIPKISQQEYDNMKNNFINIDTLAKLFNYLKGINCNFKSVACNDSVGGISPLTYLIESKYNAKIEKAQEMKNKYDILQNFIMNYRTINGDGNCFYRAVMFRYLEILVLTKNTEQLQNVIFDFINSFKSEKLRSRLVIKNMNIKPDLSLKLLILIVELLKNNMVEDAHQILVKSFSTCQKFDYAMILYLRYLLYDYIKQNENKTYLKTFPIQIGNLLPYQFETEDGKFLFDEFYEKYLLNFFTDAEKIVIYLTPFVLQIEIDIIIFDDNEKEILKSFKWEGNSELKTNEVISLLNHKNHYEIIYTPNDYKKYQKIFEIYENKQKPIILSQIDKYLKPDEKNFNALSASIVALNNAVSFEDEVKCPTMINKKKKNKNNINEANNNGINSITTINMNINNNKTNNQRVNNISRNTNNNNNNIIQNANNKDLNIKNENIQNNKHILNNNSQNNNQPKSNVVNAVKNENNNINNGYSRNNLKNQNINNNQSKINYNNGNLNQRDTNSQNNTNNINNNKGNYTNANNQNNILQKQYKYRITNHDNKPNNINENNSKINSDKNQSSNKNISSNQNYDNNYQENIKNNKNYLSNQNGNNNNRLNGNHNFPNPQNLSHQNDSNSKGNLDSIGGNQLSDRRNQIQTNINNEKNNLISDTNQNLKKYVNENQSRPNLNNTKTIPTANSDDKNKNGINISKEEHNLSNNTNINDNSNSNYNNLNQNGIKNQTEESNQSNINEDKSLDSKNKPLNDKYGQVLKDDETSKIENNNKCMECNNLIKNNKNTDICKNCLKKQIYEYTYNFYLADISAVSVVTKIFEEQIELKLKKNEKGKKYLLPGAIKKYNEIFKDENLSQKQLINEIKKKICVLCADEIKDESLELPCKCVLCSESDLNEYLNSRDLISEKCLCSERYSPEMLFQLGSFIIDKNLDYKDKILKYFEDNLKGTCCACGKKYDITVEDINYLTDSDNNNNEFLSKLNHNFCKDCYLLYSVNENGFICSICQVKHILPY